MRPGDVSEWETYRFIPQEFPWGQKNTPRRKYRILKGLSLPSLPCPAKPRLARRTKVVSLHIISARWCVEKDLVPRRGTQEPSMLTLRST